MIIIKILITGAKGQLGIDIVRFLSDYHQVIGIGKEMLDITNYIEIAYSIGRLSPDIIINCAGYTDVDGCEKDINLAYKVNTVGANNLAIAAVNTNTVLVHISTDYIFDGNKKRPYIETDKSNPLNIYGKSKLLAEQLINDICPRHYIIRTSWLYGPYGNNFVKKILRAAANKQTLKVVNDQIGSPTYTKDLIKAINLLINTNVYGTYHISNRGSCSRYDFAKKIIEYTKKYIEVLPISTKQLNNPVNRPKYSVLDNYKVESYLRYYSPHWEHALREFLENYSH